MSESVSNLVIRPDRASRARIAGVAALLVALGLGCLVTARTGPRDVPLPVRGGVEVRARRVGRERVNAVFAAAIGSTPSRSWAWPAHPRRVAGRFVRRREHARAAMWWTVADRGLVVHAIAAEDDVEALFAWWLSHSER